jgi:hypothetical protein
MGTSVESFRRTTPWLKNASLEDIWGCGGGGVQCALKDPKVHVSLVIIEKTLPMEMKSAVLEVKD